MNFVRLTECEDWEETERKQPDHPIAIAIHRIISFHGEPSGPTWLHICTHDEWEFPASAPNMEEGRSLMVREGFDEVWARIHGDLTLRKDS